MSDDLDLGTMTLTEVEELITQQTALLAELNDQDSELRVQLKEVTASISRLEKQDIAVPDELRELKLRFHGDLEQQMAPRRALDAVKARLDELSDLIPSPRRPGEKRRPLTEWSTDLPDGIYELEGCQARVENRIVRKVGEWALNTVVKKARLISYSVGSEKGMRLFLEAAKRVGDLE